MIRKLRLELQWIFPILPLFLIALTVEYTWIIQRATIMVYSDENSYGFSTSQDPTGLDEINAFLKEHPNGQVLSLRNSPQSYFIGIDGLVRNFLPFLVVALCTGGGILSEKSNGTASFALSLPVSRSLWVWSRAAALLFLTVVTAVLACAVAFILARGMGIGQNLSWLVTQPILLSLAAAPWIGVTLYIQSWLSGRFDMTSENIIALVVTELFVFFTGFFLSRSMPTHVTNPYLLLADAANAAAPQVNWKPLLAMSAVGVGCLLLTVRRFKRMDF